jgi:Bacterial Ig-like domain/Bacterial pre-peptidase C-terminal domain
MRRILVVLTTMVMGVVLASGVALAAAVSEVEPNDSIAAAQDIDASFDLTANPDINESTNIPHATVNGTGETGVDPTHDFYKFTVPEGDPVRVDLDMDHTTPDGSPQYDPWIELYDSSGTLIVLSDDDGGDPGSTQDGDDPNGRDPRIMRDGADKLAPGTYYVGVGRYVDGTIMGPVPAGATYQLHVSVGNDTFLPDTTITDGPVDGSTANPGFATFEFTASEEATFECRVDDPQGDFFSCDSGWIYTGLSAGSHTFEVRAIDNAGNVEAEAASRTWTVSDGTVPTVQSITPVNGATKVSRTNPNITATFSEAMAAIPAGSVTLQKVRVQGQRVTVLETVSTTLALQSNSTVLSITPGVTLDKGSYYRVSISSNGVTDLIGNPLQSTTTWRFKTAPR